MERPRKNVRSFATFPSKFSLLQRSHNGKFTATVGSESVREFRKDPGPGGTKFLTSPRLFVRPFVPAPDGNVGRRPNCVTLARMSRRANRKFERAKPGEREGKGRRGAEMMGGRSAGQCLISAENMEGGEGAGWIGVKVRQPDVYACYSRVSVRMAQITINMLDSRLTAVVPVPFPSPPPPSSPSGGKIYPLRFGRRGAS